ncbi:MAG: VWA domain-containing protein [Inconstantimicrobium porci]|uniref:VWA domain-containing protein n=1 Tax=Inconstantimicrobium porci TaxID=2652291 RepID=UPI002A912B22|nr:VWA domain-containing protein [Inconstantimicrobium porci]MDY5913588.1 VWA domain-containing protein [Inconstantimicrobium porci]
MRRKRTKHNVWDKRIVPILVASILLFTLMISPFTKPLGAEAAAISQQSSDDRITITKSVEVVDDTEREFKVTLNIKNSISKHADDTTLYNVVVTDVVDNGFSIVGSNGNTISKSLGSMAHNSSQTITYNIKAKSGVSGYKNVNTSSAKVNYQYKYKETYSDWNWPFVHTRWVTKDTFLQIKSPTIYVKPENIDVPDPEEGKITLNKSAVKTGDGQYRISFDVAGKIQKADPKQADIVVVIDKSTSMSYDSRGTSSGYDNSRIKAVKESVKKLAQDVLGNTSINKGNNIKIAIASFSENANIDLNFSTSINDINTAVGGQGTGIKIYTNQGTNTEAGIKMAGKLLDDSKAKRPDAVRFVVMFTDGLPTFYLAGKEDKGDNVKGPGYASPDPCFGYAQEEYNRVIGGITKLGGIGKDGYYDNRGYWTKCEYKDKTISAADGRHPDAKFYSVGFTSSDTTDNNMMINFLSSTQNVMKIKDDKDKKKFSDKYCTGSTAAIGTIFGDITNQIKQSISSIVDNAVISDVVSDEFVIPNNVGSNVKVSVNNTKIKDSEVLSSMVKSVNGQNIVFDLSKVPQEIDKNGMVKISVSFFVNVRDKYFSGNKINTNNGDAVLNYKDPKTHNQATPIKVKSPTVDIAPVEGMLYVSKYVDLKGISKADKTSNEFPIYIEKVANPKTATQTDLSRYAFNVTAGTTSTMDFYLRGQSTDITKINNALDMGKNYITAGTYKASEIVPMDYQKASIQYSYTGNDNDWTTGDTFEITKEHNKVYIKVTNNLVNNTYWRDSSNSKNEFKLTE